MTLIKEIRSAMKIGKLYVKDILFILAYFVVFFLLRNAVAHSLRIPYYIFNFVVAVILAMPSQWNPGKRMWQLILFVIKKNHNVYKPISVDERSGDFE